MKQNQYDSSWDDDDNTEAFDAKAEEWEKRDWFSWLAKNLSFPFTAIREEDENSFDPDYGYEFPFAVGHTMEVTGIDEELDCGIYVFVKEKGQTASVLLCDLAVKRKDDRNYWPVREYSVWYASCR